MVGKYSVEMRLVLASLLGIFMIFFNLGSSHGQSTDFESNWYYGVHTIKYTHIGGESTIKLQGNTLTFAIDQKSNGYLLVGIPRSFLNSYNFCDEVPFGVQSGAGQGYSYGGQGGIISSPRDYEEYSVDELRILKIDLRAGESPLFLYITGTDAMKHAQDKTKECVNRVQSTNNPSWTMTSSDLTREGIFIGDSFDYVDSLGYLHIVGEIINNHPKSAGFVKVVAVLYDEEENLLDTSFSYARIDVIPPYSKSPFDVVFSGGSEGVKTYGVQIEWVPSLELPMALEIKQPKISTDSLGNIHIKGEIENQGNSAAHFVKVVGMLYDSKKQPIGTSFTYTKLTDIYPKQKASYDLVFDDYFGNVVSYQLHVQSQEYGMIYQHPFEVSVEIHESEGIETVETESDNAESTIKPLECGEGTIEQNGKCVVQNLPEGSCLIATAAFGSELAPQVQLLREVRDNVLFSTSSGTSFMTAFNAVYYSFSPTVADWERQNPAFKEVVRTAITPMLSTLSILNYVDIDSEQEMLGYGVGIILLNIGMYFVAPVMIILKIRKFCTNLMRNDNYK